MSEPRAPRRGSAPVGAIEPAPDGTSRREFLKTTAALSAATLTASLPLGRLYAAGDDTLRVGVIGCGGRGTGAARDCIRSSPGVKVTALGDLFPDRLETCVENLTEFGDKFDVPPERRFSGFDAYQQVIASGVDLVILATPPVFRPIHIAAAVEAGKHIFAEKPVAVDPTGVRSVIESARLAGERGLAIVAGTQRRHQDSYRETMRRIHDGAIGEIVGGQCYWNQGGLWVHTRKPEYSDMEWQIRNWLYFSWTSGDHIVEQHVHNLDVMNWAMKSHPVQVMAMGGRQARTDEKYGNIYDHFSVELEYPGGVRIQSLCRQIPGSDSRIGERLVGTLGTSDPNGRIDGPHEYRHPVKNRPNPYEVEHADLIASIRAGEPLNEGKRIAESTLVAIMGRMSAYTGKVVKWDFALESKLDLTPETWEFGEHAVDGVAIPGQTPLL